MPLDLLSVSRHLDPLGRLAVERQAENTRRARQALQLLARGDDARTVAEKVDRANTGWRAGRPVEPLSLRRPAAVVPSEFSILASDGSAIEPDRHGVALCYLINVGLVAIHYGSRPQAVLHSEPYLGYTDEDLYIASGGNAVLVSGALLAIRRQTLESQRLAALAESLPRGRAAVAVQDGTLMLGTLEGPGLETWLREGPLKDLLRSYDRFRALGLPLSSYVSRPRSAEVVNTLRLLLCPATAPDCSRGCAVARESSAVTVPPCHCLAGLTDANLFSRTLTPGERSPVFRSQWQTSLQSYGEHQVHFFYVNVGPEVARVEVPFWVVADSALLDLVHAAVVDQAAKGMGYPTALIEAHEQAVLRAADRRQFDEMVGTALSRSGLPVETSEKERSKRLRSL